MPSTSVKNYVTYIAQDLLAALGPIKTRAMFGGHGFYFEGKIFGIESNGKIYFKVNAATKSDYEQAGSSPFQYTAKDVTHVSQSYWEVPERVLENNGRAIEWARKAIQVSFTGTSKT